MLIIYRVHILIFNVKQNIKKRRNWGIFFRTYLLTLYKYYLPRTSSNSYILLSLKFQQIFEIFTMHKIFWTFNLFRVQSYWSSAFFRQISLRQICQILVCFVYIKFISFKILRLKVECFVFSPRVESLRFCRKRMTTDS